MKSTLTSRHRILRTLVALSLGLAASIAVPIAQPVSDSNGTWTWTSTGNTITITFTPNATNVNCPKIVLVQTVRNIFIDATGMEMVMPATAMLSTWAYKDNDAASDMSYVDHLFCEKDPYYNGDDVPQDRSTAGTAGQGASAGDGSATTPATLSDRPNLPDGNFPAGKESVRFEYETCAVCAAGPNAGQVYGCIKWTYERTKGSPGLGTVMVTSTGVEAQSPSHAEALETFVDNHTIGGVPACPEDIPAGDCANRVYNRRLPYIWHLNDTYDVGPVDGGVEKGHTDPNGTDPLRPPTTFTPITRGDRLVACDWIRGPAGKRICIRRNSDLQGPDPQIPFLATFVDHFGGDIETVEAALCLQAQHCGVRVKACGTADTLAAAGPVNGSDSEGLVMFSSNIDDAADTVTFKNDPLSSHDLQVFDVQGGGSGVVYLSPGATITFSYPGSIGSCVATAPPGVIRTPAVPVLGVAAGLVLLTLTGYLVLRRGRPMA